jgi:hypothetical protein
MFEAFSPATDMALTILTSRLVIEGTVTTRVRRLVDLVNDANAAHLIVHDAMFMELESGRVLNRAEYAQLWLEDLLILHTREPIESGSVRTPKQPTPATLLVAPYTVEGTIHLPFESELRMALDAYSDRFVAVTDARYWPNSEPDAPISVDLAVVNHRRAHVAIAPGVHWDGAAGPVAAETAENPW